MIEPLRVIDTRKEGDVRSALVAAAGTPIDYLSVTRLVDGCTSLRLAIDVDPWDEYVSARVLGLRLDPSISYVADAIVGAERDARTYFRMAAGASMPNLYAGALTGHDRSNLLRGIEWAFEALALLRPHPGAVPFDLVTLDRLYGVHLRLDAHLDDAPPAPRPATHYDATRRTYTEGPRS